MLTASFKCAPYQFSAVGMSRCISFQYPIKPRMLPLRPLLVCVRTGPRLCGPDVGTYSLRRRRMVVGQTIRGENDNIRLVTFYGPAVHLLNWTIQLYSAALSAV